ncbi:hypothetical protein SODALDRAFT_108610 [Sodiomyces alkalinus F11]|uniref:Uncharacterized protein n=1 Tax=Sodiomyces alkalinus (strain CBS 110278 / VKM F-3762 / F11) TaxID=1314773 RepID=A0A3N2Q2G5_SODAK|nr:hypothetical protein SODALDRAFT_108610 [Sodiomyces alkalinus F11]ROT40959.1 hypothetical protein SODALDRAFT_108610 [Sodiomyces alkalinus F11]
MTNKQRDHLRSRLLPGFASRCPVSPHPLNSACSFHDRRCCSLFFFYPYIASPPPCFVYLKAPKMILPIFCTIQAALWSFGETLYRSPSSSWSRSFYFQEFYRPFAFFLHFPSDRDSFSGVDLSFTKGVPRLLLAPASGAAMTNAQAGWPNYRSLLKPFSAQAKTPKSPHD